MVNKVLCVTLHVLASMLWRSVFFLQLR